MYKILTFLLLSFFIFSYMRIHQISEFKDFMLIYNYNQYKQLPSDMYMFIHIEKSLDNYFKE